MITNKLLRSFLFEDVALTKGCQRIFNNANLVKNIADTLKEEAEFHPSSFPGGIAKKIVKAPDERAAHWFLEQLDAIEQRGYEGTVYSRDGADADWIVKTFVNGTSNFEDILGNLNMCLRDWYLLKNRNALEPQHKELSRFKSINQLGAVVTHHYADQIEEFRNKAANTAKQKLSKNILLVDNDDYRIYVPFNRIASCLLGDKAKWCTANTEYDTHFHSYADRAMLFIVMPYYKDKETGKKSLVPHEVEITQGARAGQKTKTNEKFQFDSSSGDFMDITNHNVDPRLIAERFPYLYSDVENALKEKKPSIEAALKAASEDPATLGDKDTKVKTYDVDKQIAALDRFRKKGHFTDQVRPKEKPAAEEPAQQLPSPAKPITEGYNMESIRDLAYLMLENINLNEFDMSGSGDGDGGGPGDNSDNDSGAEGNWKKNVEKFIKNVAIYAAKAGYKSDNICEASDITDIVNYMPEEYFDFWFMFEEDTQDELAVKIANKLYDITGSNTFDSDLDEDEELGSADTVATGGSTGSMGGAGPSSGSKYPPGTAPTMPESHKLKGNKIMEKNVDKDVAAMLASLKKLDKLTESCAPVLGMRTLGEKTGKPEWLEDAEKKAERKEGKKADKEDIEEGTDEDNNPWKNLAKKDEKNGKTTKTATGLKHEKDYSAKKDKEEDKEDKEDKEDIDEDIMSWTKRFAALDGNIDEAVRGVTSGPSGKHLPIGKNARDAVAKGLKDNRTSNKETGKFAVSKGVQSGKSTYHGPDVSTVNTNEGANQADATVLEWMSRFANLGNMKGYGR